MTAKDLWCWTASICGGDRGGDRSGRPPSAADNDGGAHIISLSARDKCGAALRSGCGGVCGKSSFRGGYTVHKTNET